MQMIERCLASKSIEQFYFSVQMEIFPFGAAGALRDFHAQMEHNHNLFGLTIICKDRKTELEHIVMRNGIACRIFF